MEMMAGLSIIAGDERLDLLRDETLVDIFRQTVSLYPQKIALIADDQSLTYQQLDIWSDQLALLLRQAGCQSGSAVVLYWPRGLALHVAILAIVKAGCCYVPVDEEVPAERVLQIAAESDASLIITNKELTGNWPVIAVPPMAPASGDLPIITWPAPQPDDDAYIIYTSGSTGKPKGIPIQHRQICHLIRAEQDILQITPQDRVYQGFLVSFDMWGEEVWISYLVGAVLVVASALTAKAIDELPDFWRKNHITVLHVVPSLLAIIDGAELPHIRVVNTGGEACTPMVLEKWCSPLRRVINSYGPTETTVTASMGLLHANQPIQLGKPLANYGMAVVDENLNPLPYGTAGELVISGVGVSRGYIKRPELTAEKFLPLPATLSMLQGHRLYRTGDQALMDADGVVHFNGRVDDQVKLRGYRIELGEIENLLQQLPEIRAALVSVIGEEEGKQLVCALELNKGALDSHHSSDWRAFLAERLPAYMIPAEFLVVASLPRLASGKLDRKGVKNLFSPVQALPPPLEEYSPQQSVAERLSTALKAVFPQQKIDLSQDFFTDLGGIHY